jgi:CheY-like chemotaxis protein
MPTNVLVVDDNRIFRESFCTLLEECFDHMQIVPVSDGISALGVTYKIPFDLIVLDYELATMSGSDIVRRLRARGRPLPPIVFMSAHPDIAIFARLNMVDGYLSKPVSPEDIHAVIGPLLREQTRHTTGPNVWRPIEAHH